MIRKIRIPSRDRLGSRLQLPLQGKDSPHFEVLENRQRRFSLPRRLSQGVRKVVAYVQAGRLEEKDKENQGPNQAVLPGPVPNRQTRLPSGPSRANRSCILQSQFQKVRFNDEFKVEKRLGEGSYAKVQQCLKKDTNQRFAVKIYQRGSIKEPHRLANVRREIAILKRLEHDGVVKLFSVGTQRSKLFLFMQVGGQQSLNSYWKRKDQRKLPISECRTIIRGIVEAVGYIHGMGVCHRDLKMQNVLLQPTSLSVKLIDFGFATQCKEDRLTVFCGTPSYMSPEVASKTPYRGRPADIWSLGVMLYCLCFGYYPFRAQDEADLFRKIISGKVVFPEDADKSLKQLLGRMLSKDPLLRPTASDLLEESWLNQ